MGIRLLGPAALVVCSALTACTTSGSSPMMPKALRGAGQSSHLVGMPAGAAELKLIWSSRVFARSLSAALRG